LRPKRILDCPIGTCRWASEYARLELDELHGLDASADMLAKSTLAAEAAGVLNHRFQKADLMSDGFPKLIPAVDLVVCVRFLNWLDEAQTAGVLRNLCRVTTPALVVGLSCLPSDWSLLQRISSKVRLKSENWLRTRRGLAPIFVHDQEWFEKLLDDLSLKIERKDTIFEDKVRVNHFYTLRPTS
jgi:ubiquinone/menaquinone biosynthesis C-methylase UbiE